LNPSNAFFTRGCGRARSAQKRLTRFELDPVDRRVASGDPEWCESTAVAET
jgi:hypothetical protein